MPASNATSTVLAEIFVKSLAGDCFPSVLSTYNVYFNSSPSSGSEPSQEKVTLPSDDLDTVDLDKGVFNSAGKGV